MTAHKLQGASELFGGQLAAALPHLAAGLALYRDLKHRHLATEYGEDPGLVCHNYSAQALWLLGHPDQARRHLDESTRLAEELGDPVSRAMTLWRGAVVAQCCGHVDSVEGQADALVALCAHEALPQWLAAGTMLQGWARTRRGQAAAGIALIGQGLRDWRATGAEIFRPHFLGLLAEACAEAGDPRAGLRQLTEALALVEATGETWYEPELHRLTGELSLQRGAGHPGPGPQPEACFHRAIELARARGARSLELRAVTSLGRQRWQRGKRSEAARMLRTCYDGFTEGFDTAYLQEAKALLDEWVRAR